MIEYRNIILFYIVIYLSKILIFFVWNSGKVGGSNNNHYNVYDPINFNTLIK